eukprot:GHVR01180087.1.p1 GENE.GHVR01180087.1~~GHVR01180087.1.p1  ORF type:complete len:304 (+),score=41.98 GHVR01180087.1:871-1782(+)
MCEFVLCVCAKLQKLLNGFRAHWADTPVISVFGAFCGIYSQNNVHLPLSVINFYVRAALMVDSRLARQTERNYRQKELIKEKELEKTIAAKGGSNAKTKLSLLGKMAGGNYGSRGARQIKGKDGGRHYAKLADIKGPHARHMLWGDGEAVMKKMIPMCAKESDYKFLLGGEYPAAGRYNTFLDSEWFLERLMWQYLRVERQKEFEIAQEYREVVRCESLVSSSMSRAEFRNSVLRSVMCMSPSLEQVRADPIFSGVRCSRFFPQGANGDLWVGDISLEPLHFKSETENTHPHTSIYACDYTQI